MRGNNAAGTPGADNLDDVNLNSNLDLEDADEATDETGEELGDDAGEDAGDENLNDDLAGQNGNKRKEADLEDLSEKRKLQLANDRLGNEVGALRKGLDLVASLLERAGIGLPTPEDWAKDPDKAAKIDQEYKQGKKDIEDDRRRSQAMNIVLARNPDFESLVPGMITLLKEDGVADDAIERFKQDPFSTIDPTILHNLARAARFQRRVSAEAPRKAPSASNRPAADRVSFPTNDRAGQAPVAVKGPMTVERLAALAEKNPAALGKALEGATKQEIDALAEVLMQRKQRRR